MAGYAGNPICSVHADVTFTRARSRSRGDDRQRLFGGLYQVTNHDV